MASFFIDHFYYKDLDVLAFNVNLTFTGMGTYSYFIIMFCACYQSIMWISILLFLGKAQMFPLKDFSSPGGVSLARLIVPLFKYCIFGDNYVYQSFPQGEELNIFFNKLCEQILFCFPIMTQFILSS